MPNKKRAGGVCIYDNKILLMHRINLERVAGEQEYYVIPGGGVEDGETVEQAVVRELDEETSVMVSTGELILKRYVTETDRDEYYYVCTYVSGEPKLREDTNEFEEMKLGVHFYKPMWLALSEINNVTIYPVEIKDILVKKFL